ncbi:Hydrogenase maturation protease family protein [Rhodospirillaceae bacterium LM-1]|nr:Hydrogenase maturation protease family protein [Rhodospirillaceae bacterium LM-1]
MTANDALIIGIGNEFRRDDSAGLLVAARIEARNLPGVEVLTHHGEGTGLMSLWQGRSLVVVVDAVSSGQDCGTLHVVNTRCEPIPSGWTLFSSHAFGLAEAVELARDLGELPQSLWIVGVEGKDFSHGQELSPAVAHALENAVTKVIELVRPMA